MALEDKHIQTFNIVALIFLAVILFPASNVKFSTDSMTYIQKALYIAEDFSYKDLTRGPVFPALSALSISLFDYSAFVLMALVRVMYVVCVLAFAALAWRLYGWVGGWVGVLYFALAPLLQWPATKFHVDIFLLAFVLTFMLCLYEAHARRHRGLGLLAGALLGLAFLTKETALLLFPLLAVTWLLFPGAKRSLWAVSRASIAGLLVILLPWFLFVLFSTGSGSVVLGQNINESGTFGTFLGKFFGDPIHMFLFLFDHFIRFINIYLIGTGPLVAGMGAYGWLLIAGVVYLMVRTAIYRRPGDMLLLLALLLHGPFMIYLGWATYDHRQAVVIFSLAAFGVPAIASDLQAWLARSSVTRNSWVNASLCLGLFCGIGAALMAQTPSFPSRFGGHFHSFTLFLPGVPSFKTNGALSPNLVEAAEWLRDHTRSQDAIMAAHRRPGRYLEFALTNKIIFPPEETYNLKSRRQSDLRQVGTSFRQHAELIYIHVNRSPDGPVNCVDETKTVKGIRFCKLYYLREDEFIESLKNYGARYFLVTPRYEFFTAYLDQNAGFEKLIDFGSPTQNPDAVHLRDKVTIYKVGEVASVGDHFRPIVNYSFPRFMDFYSKLKPEEAILWTRAILSHKFGASEKQIAAIQSGKVDCFTYDLTRPAFQDCMRER